MKISAKSFHDKLIAKNGVNAASGFSEKGRIARFEVIADLLGALPPRYTAIDYGCNDGALFDWLVTDTAPDYYGVDIHPKFIALAEQMAKEHLQGGRTEFMVGHINQPETFARFCAIKPDAVVASGVFCYTGEKHRYRRMIRRLFQTTQRLLIFNVLTAKSKAPYDKARGTLRWSMPELMQLINASGAEAWRMHHDYLRNDITVVLYKRFCHEP